MGKTKIECKKLEVLSGDQKCVFCSQTDIDEIKYGPIYMHKNIITHYYCLLLSSNMEQNGRDSDGILGFLANDIHKEVRRGVRLYCTYCRKGGATLGCAIAKCKVVFHLPCGMKHGTLHQFFGEFKSYCAKHRPVQKISPKILAESSKNAMCGICYEKVVPRPIHETLWAPCCQKSAFFHRDCVQKLATSAGYFFKCPLCNNTNTFQKEMKEYGIYIPEQDASWECVPNAYQDLLVRHDKCDHVSCSCPSGRKTNNQGTRWELILCKFCGSQGMHIGCGRLKWKSPEFVCDTCSGNNEGEEEADTRNYLGNRHRLSGTGRTAEIHPSVSADREAERSDEGSSDESEKVTVSNRSGRRRVISPPPKVETPPPDTRPHKKSEKHRKRSDSTSTKAEATSLCDDVTVVIDDSDDDVEVVGETKGRICLKTNDGSTIPIVKVRDSVKKRLNVEGDINVVEEIVDITFQRDGPPLKKHPPSHVEEIIYDFPSQPPKPSPSTSYCPPSTSVAAPPPLDVTKFVLVDPATFRPEDLPPGTVLYRSFTPMMPAQPQLQPTTQVPMPQLGRPGGRSADAKHPDLCKHGRRSSFHLHAPAHHAKKTSRSDERNSSRRRRGRGCDHDRLNPTVPLSPLKSRLSNDGYFEILVPRRNLGFGYSSGSLKRKASPLPSRPTKKIKKSQKDTTANDKKKQSCSSKQKTLKQRVKTPSNAKTERIEGNKKPKVSKIGKTGKKNINKSSSLLLKFFPTNKTKQVNKKKQYSSKSKKGKDSSSPEKITKENKSVLVQWKYKRIDEYLNKYDSKLTLPSNNLLKNTEQAIQEESPIQENPVKLDEPGIQDETTTQKGLADLLKKTEQAIQEEYPIQENPVIQEELTFQEDPVKLDEPGIQDETTTQKGLADLLKKTEQAIQEESPIQENPVIQEELTFQENPVKLDEPGIQDITTTQKELAMQESSGKEVKSLLTVQEIFESIFKNVVSKHSFTKIHTMFIGNCNIDKIPSKTSDKSNITVQNFNSKVIETKGHDSNASSDINYEFSLDCSSKNASIFLENSSPIVTFAPEKKDVFEKSLENPKKTDFKLPALELSVDNRSEDENVIKKNNQMKIVLEEKLKTEFSMSNSLNGTPNKEVGFKSRGENHNLLVSHVEEKWESEGKSEESSQIIIGLEASNDQEKTILKSNERLKCGAVSPNLFSSWVRISDIDDIYQTSNERHNLPVSSEDLEGAKEVNLNATKLLISSTCVEKKCAIKSLSLFPKIKINSQKSKRKNESQVSSAKKRKIENVCLEFKGISNTKTMKRLIGKGKTKDPVGRFRRDPVGRFQRDPSKTKKQEIGNDSSGMLGSIERYFTPIKKDYTCSPTKTFGNLIYEKSVSTTEENSLVKSPKVLKEINQ